MIIIEYIFLTENKDPFSVVCCVGLLTSILTSPIYVVIAFILFIF